MADYWIKGEDGEEYGPVPLEELAEWVEENRAGIDTPVRTGPQAEWKPWQSYPELAELLISASAGVLFPGQPHLVLGSYLARVAAYIFDIMMVLMIFMLLIAFFVPASAQKEAEQLWKQMLEGHHPSPNQSGLILALIGLVVYVAYFTYFHGRTGQTPGKRLFRLRVVDAHGLTISYWQAFLRTIGAYLSMQFFCIGHFFAFITTHRQAFHDLAARTFVVRAAPPGERRDG